MTLNEGISALQVENLASPTQPALGQTPTMNRIIVGFVLALFYSSNLSFAEEIKGPRVAELNAFWTEVSRSVSEGDFDAYQASCHPEGVLVSGI